MKFLLAILFVCLCVSVKALDITVKVVDIQTASPLEKASVTVVGTKNGAITDFSGKALLTGLSTGNYALSVSCIGYVPVHKKIVVTATETTVIVIRLSPDNKKLGAVTITGMTQEQAEEKKIKESVMPVTILTSKQIENRAIDLTELLARQTGVQIRRTGGLGSDARISIRGLEGKRVQIYVDGNPLETPDGSLGINDLPLQIIERVEIYKGTIPAWLGGDGLGSAINVVTKHRHISYIDAMASYQSYHTLKTGLILKKTLDKQGIELGMGAFTNSSDNDYTMESPYQPGLMIKRDHDKFKSTLIGGGITFRKLWFDKIELQGGYLNSRKQVQGIRENIQYVHSEGKSLFGVLEMKKKLLGDKLSLKYHGLFTSINVGLIDTSSFSYDWEGHSRPSIYGKGELGIGPNLSTTKQKEFREQVNINYILNDVFTLNLNNTLRYGTLAPHDSLANAYAGKNLFGWPGHLFHEITGLTLETTLDHKKLLFSTAIKHYYSRVNGYNTNIYVQTTPDKVKNVVDMLGYNAGMRYNFTDALMVKASHERAVRFPNNAELFGDGVLVTPAIKLQPEIAFNNTAGVIYDKTSPEGNRLQLESNLFYMSVSNMIQLSGNGLSLGYVNFAKAAIYGVDAEAKYDITRALYGMANITYQSVRDRNRYIPGSAHVPNPTYRLAIPNIPQLFANWSLEYTLEDLLGKNSRTKLLYEGSYTQSYNYGFNISRYDHFEIPKSLTHTLSLEQSFRDKRYNITVEVDNFTNERVINNFNQPLPGRTFRVKLRYLFLDTKNKNHSSIN